MQKRVSREARGHGTTKGDGPELRNRAFFPGGLERIAKNRVARRVDNVQSVSKTTFFDAKTNSLSSSARDLCGAQLSSAGCERRGQGRL